MKKKQKRLWIRDFRIPNTPDNRYVASLMEIWRQHRERPTHFTRAIRLYMALVEGDLDSFFDILIVFAPKTARILMQSQVSAPVNAPPAKVAKPKPEKLPTPTLEDAPANPANVDDFMQSLGLSDMDFE